MADTAVTAARAMLDDVERRIAHVEAENERLISTLAATTDRAHSAEGELRLITDNLADREPRPGIEYLTSKVYAMRRIGRGGDVSAISKALGIRAARIGRERGVLSISVSSGNSTQSAHAWPISVWDKAFDEYEASFAH